MTRSTAGGAAGIYDQMAARYDEAYRDPVAAAEDDFVDGLVRTAIELRTKVEGWPAHILDVGCGTGFGLGMASRHLRHGWYTGIDPSQAMLDAMKQKRAVLAGESWQVNTRRRTLEEYAEDAVSRPNFPQGRHDLVLSLFSACYSKTLNLVSAMTKLGVHACFEGAVVLVVCPTRHRFQSGRYGAARVGIASRAWGGEDGPWAYRAQDLSIMMSLAGWREHASGEFSGAIGRRFPRVLGVVQRFDVERDFSYYIGVNRSI